MPDQDINITNSRGLDAVVSGLSVTPRPAVRWVDETRAQVTSVQVLRGTMACDIDRLLEATGGDVEVATNMIVFEDAEVDTERYGLLLRETSRIWVNARGEQVYKVTNWEVHYRPDGQETQRHPKQVSEGNVSAEIPLRWTGRTVPRAKALRRFVFSGTVQLVHTNGLTYDFLFEMARDLEAQDALMLLGAGPKGNEPLIFRRGGLPYRGFLEGRTAGSKYMLLLHLSSLELRQPSPEDLPPES